MVGSLFHRPTRRPKEVHTHVSRLRADRITRAHNGGMRRIVGHTDGQARRIGEPFLQTKTQKFPLPMIFMYRGNQSERRNNFPYSGFSQIGD